MLRLEFVANERPGVCDFALLAQKLPPLVRDGLWLAADQRLAALLIGEVSQRVGATEIVAEKPKCCFSVVGGSTLAVALEVVQKLLKAVVLTVLVCVPCPERRL